MLDISEAACARKEVPPGLREGELAGSGDLSTTRRVRTVVRKYSVPGFVLTRSAVRLSYVGVGQSAVDKWSVTGYVSAVAD